MNQSYKNYEEQSKAYMQALIADAKQKEDAEKIRKAQEIVNKLMTDMHIGLDYMPAHTRRESPPTPCRAHKVN